MPVIPCLLDVLDVGMGGYGVVGWLVAGSLVVWNSRAGALLTIVGLGRTMQPRPVVQVTPPVQVLTPAPYVLHVQGVLHVQDVLHVPHPLIVQMMVHVQVTRVVLVLLVGGVMPHGRMCRLCLFPTWYGGAGCPAWWGGAGHVGYAGSAWGRACAYSPPMGLVPIPHM